MTAMRRVILQIQLDPAQASVDHVRQVLGLRADQIDAAFGVRRLRADQNEYAVRVDADVAQTVRGESTKKPAGGQVSVALVH
jgi:hypothetical protein